MWSNVEGRRDVGQQQQQAVVLLLGEVLDVGLRLARRSIVAVDDLDTDREFTDGAQPAPVAPAGLPGVPALVRELQDRSLAIDDVVRRCPHRRWRRIRVRSEEHTSELQSQSNLVCRLLLEKK